MKNTLLIAIFFLISLAGFSQSFTELLSYNSAPSDAFDGISGDCNVGIKVSTTQNGIYIDHHLQSFDLKTLRIANKDIPASQVPSYVILDKRVYVTYDLYVNNVFIEHHGQPSVSWAKLQGLPNSDSYKPATSTNGYKLYNSGAISIRNVKISKLTYRVDEKYYTQIRNEIAEKNNKNTTNNPVKQGNSTSLTIENSNSVTQPKTTTGIPANTSTKTSIEQIPDNYKGNPMTYNTPSAYSDNTTTQVLNSATNILNQWASQIKSDNDAEEARQNRIEDERVRKQNIADELRANKFRLIHNRKSLIAKFPDGKTPLSYEVKGATEIFYFVYSYQATTIENNSPPIYISNVFSLVKYGDGTWPLKASLIENIAKTNKGLNLVLSGYYLNKNDAEQQQQFFISEATNFDFVVNKINYETKKSAQTTSGSLDYWGNPIKKEVQQSNIKTPATNEVEKPKIKVDYWGNIIKEKTTN